MFWFIVVCSFSKPWTWRRLFWKVWPSSRKPGEARAMCWLPSIASNDSDSDFPRRISQVPPRRCGYWLERAWVSDFERFIDPLASSFSLSRKLIYDSCDLVHGSRSKPPVMDETWSWAHYLSVDYVLPRRNGIHFQDYAHSCKVLLYNYSCTSHLKEPARQNHSAIKKTLVSPWSREEIRLGLKTMAAMQKCWNTALLGDNYSLLFSAAIVRRIPEGTNETVMRSPAASSAQRGAVVLPRSLFQSQGIELERKEKVKRN